MQVYIWKKCQNFDNDNYKKYLHTFKELISNIKFVDGQNIKKIKNF